MHTLAILRVSVRTSFVSVKAPGLIPKAGQAFTRLTGSTSRAVRCQTALSDTSADTPEAGTTLASKPESAEAQAALAQAQPLQVGLYLVATPIGNLEDITYRAVRVLQEVDTIFAEDCRHTAKLTQRYGITTPLVSYHQHNEARRSGAVLQRLERGLPVALVSDAGCPGISDPGAVAVQAAIEGGFAVVAVPGPSAVLAALTASGLPTASFSFVGFLPAKRAARRAALASMRAHVTATSVVYVSPHALRDNLADMCAVLGGHRRCCVARELTKVHESFYRGSLDEVQAMFVEHEPRGELVIVVEGSTAAELAQGVQQEASKEQRLTELLEQGVALNAAARQVSSEFGMRRKELYTLALEIQKSLQQQGEQTEKPD